MNQFDDCSCIIRAFGERTLDLCRAILSSAGFRPIVVTGVPFGATLRASFAVAIEQDRKYSMMIDADTIPNPAALPGYLEYARKMSVFSITSMCKCFLFQKVRKGGSRIYKTPMLEEAIKKVDVSADRPEREIVLRYGYKVYDKTVFNHGYEQYYRDIWRTGFFHGVKSRSSGALIKSLATLQKRTEPDCVVAAAAIRAGIGHKKNKPVPEIDYARFGLVEKNDLTPKEIERLAA
jgi:hypothetical protein